MKRKFLEDLLKGKLVDESGMKELVDTILDEHSTAVGKLKGDLETANTKVDTLEAENKTLKEDITNRDTQLENLKNSTEDVEGLKTQIATLQAENQANTEKHTQEMNALKKSVAIEKGLSNAKARNIKAVLGLLDLDKIELEEDGVTLKGLSEQIDGLLQDENSKFLFDTETEQKQFKGAEPGEPGDVEPTKQNADYSGMSYEEIAKQMDNQEN